MSLQGLLTQTVVIHHRTQTGSTDDYNTPAWSESTTTVPAYVEPISRTEAGPVGLATHRAFFNPDVTLDARDLVTLDGVAFEVVGIPGKEPDARLGTIHHIEADLAEVQE